MTSFSPIGSKKKLRIIHPNKGVEARFQKQLESLIDEMQSSLVYWLTAAYRSHKPDTIAQDASSAAILNKIMERLTRQWMKRFGEASDTMAPYYAHAAVNHTDHSIKSALQGAGMAVEFKVTAPIQNVITSSTKENAGLIKSIASQHLADVQGLLMRSVQQGHDLGTLRKELEHRYGITRRRAALIARTSNRQATAAIEKQRAADLGIEEAYWVHSNAGKEPRPEHQRWNGTKYNISEGKYSTVSKKYVWPGTDFNCFPGDSVIEFLVPYKKLWRRRYDGELTVIKTDSGKTIKATPNHPILTQRGWIAIKNITLSDDVLKVSKQVFGVLDRNVERNVSTISQIFDAASAFIMRSRIGATGLEFHGDTTNEEIDIIDIDGFLRDEFDVVFCQEFCKLFFSNAENIIPSIFLDCIGSFYLAASRLFGASHSLVGGLCAVFSLLRSTATGADDARLSLTSYMHMCLDQAASNTGSCFLINPGKLKLRDSGLVFGDDIITRELFNLFFRGMGSMHSHFPSADFLCDLKLTGDAVVRKHHEIYHGYVYNMETATNWYSHQHYIVHNCRCTSRLTMPTNFKITRPLKNT